MRHRRWAWSAVTAFAVLAAACSSGTSGPAAAGTPFPSPSALNAARAPLLPTDRFALPTFDYSTFTTLLSQLKGTPVVVNIWASWCGPCRIEGPHLAAAAHRYGEQVQFLGVDILDQRGPAQSFIREFGWPYPSVSDPTGDIRDHLGFVGVPVTVFFDRQGHRVAVSAGAISSEQLATDVQKLLA